MVFKGLTAAVTAAALVVTPTVAAAQTAARTGSELAPQTESVEGSELRGGFIIPLIALIAIILGLCAGTNICGGDDDDLPKSP